MGGGGEEWVAVGGLDCCDEMPETGDVFIRLSCRVQ